MFAQSGTTWSRQARLTAGAKDREFGYSVAISDSTVVVGAPEAGPDGMAYVFVHSGSTWSRQAQLTAADSAATDFGWSVAISGSTVVVGAPGKNVISGAAYVFVRTGNTWSRQAELTASDGASSTVSEGWWRSRLDAGGGRFRQGSETGVVYVFWRSGAAGRSRPS